MPFFGAARTRRPADPKAYAHHYAGRTDSRSSHSQDLGIDGKKVVVPRPAIARAHSSTAMMAMPTAKPEAKAPTARFVATAEKLGTGAYGAVLLGKEAATSAPVAIKFIPEGRMRSSSLEREVAMLRRLTEIHHPALVRFYAHVRPSEARAGEVGAEGTLPLAKHYTQCHAIVMEAARGGELFDHVVRADGLREGAAAPLFAQLCDAVRAAHGLGIAHRDLKLENVLLVDTVKPKAAERRATAVDAQRIKLIDWGLAHQHELTPDGRVVHEKLHSRCGSRSYMAPEVTNREISGTVGYDGFAADVWSLGVCLFAMHLAFFPFEQAHPENDWRAERVVEAQKNGESTVATILSFYPQKPFALSPSLVSLLDRMLLFDPRRRATLGEVLHSDWLLPHLSALRAHLGPLDFHGLSLHSTRTERTNSAESSSTITSYTSPTDYDSRSSLTARDSTAAGLRRQYSSTSTVCSGVSDYTSASRPSVPQSRDVSAPPSPVPEAPTRPASPTTRPASPTIEYRANRPTVEVVIAGARAGMLAQQSLKESSLKEKSLTEKSLKEHSQKSLKEHSADIGASGRTAVLASLLSKSCKVGRGGSPRRPETMSTC